MSELCRLVIYLLVANGILTFNTVDVGAPSGVTDELLMPRRQFSDKTK